MIPVHVGTWANLLTGYPASLNSGKSAHITDVPQGALSMVYSDGLYWRPVQGRVALGRSRVPMGVPQSSASLAANGAFTLAGSGLPFATLGAVWLYLPANTVATGAPAGWYYAVMSSATAGTLYTNTFDPLVSENNLPPAAPTACTAANTGGWVGVTSEVTAYRLKVPANLMGFVGEVEWILATYHLGTTDTKTTKVKFGGTIVTQSSQTSNVSHRITNRVWNMGATNKQMTITSTSDGGSASAFGAVIGVDTTVDVYVDVTLQISATTNNQSLVMGLFDLEFKG